MLIILRIPSTNQIMSTIDILDIAGTFVFAVAGAFRATRHHLDLLGIMVLAVATGVGGGMMRDMLLGATPVAAIQSELYLGVCLAGGVLVFLAADRVATQWNRVMIMDAIGLGVFAAIGGAKGMAFGLGPIGVMIMAALTATGGGVVRDILVREIPAIIRHDFYATAALLGGATLLLAEATGLNGTWQIVSAALVTSGLRFFAMTRNVGLPKAKLSDQSG
ncbi:MAG: trimeric intracellular cation channel family protein [Rhodothermales bacterium]